MATLQTKTFAQVVQDQATAAQGSTGRFLVDFSVGSILRAVIEASSAVVMWLQGLILQLLATTRAATATGADLDTWMTDFGLTRLAAVAATGSVTFSRFTPTTQAIVPVGSLVQSTDGTQQFTVVADTTQSAYNSALGGYVLPPATASITTTVVALTTGAGGNAAIGAINTLGQAISGVDTVTNAASFTNGANAEADVAFRARFQSYIASLSKATKGAVGYAVQSVRTGLTYTLVEDYNFAGSYLPGYFYVVLDDGTGAPSSGLIAQVSSAIEAVRPIGTSFGVFAPSIVTANIAANITTAAGYDHGIAVAAVTAAITNYINALPLGASLIWSRLFQVAFDASAAVSTVTVMTINSATTDLAATPQQAILPGTVTVI